MLLNVSYALDKPKNDEGHGIHAGNECVEYEKEEEFMIANSDTIVHPRTVMVHFENAAFADAAVMRSIRFEGFATTADSFGWAGIGFGGFEEFHF